MNAILLTQHDGLLIGPIAKVMGLILNAVYEFLQTFGIEKVAASVVIVTIIVYIFMLPLTIKQQKSTKILKHVNPEIQKLQKKYKGKRDPESTTKMNAELKAIYQKYGTTQMSGCLTGLIQMPIMIALYAVVSRIAAYIGDIRQVYSNIVEQIQGIDGYQEKVANVLDGMKGVKIGDYENIDSFINGISKFSMGQLNTLADTFPGIDGFVNELDNINTVFLGINIVTPPGIKGVAIIIPILVWATQFVSNKLNQANMDLGDESNPMVSSMKTMTNVMPFMTAFMSVVLPAGMGIYWIVGSLFRTVQQIFLNRYIRSKDVQYFIDQNRAKQNKKRERKGLNPIDYDAIDNEKTVARHRRYQPKNKEDSLNPAYEKGSIAATANILKEKKYNQKTKK